jgi:tetratricopeptide (TPR) repeat protein
MANLKKLLQEANNFRSAGQIEKAVETYEKLAQAAYQQGNPVTEALAQHMAGVSCKEGVTKEGDLYFQRALSYYAKAKEISARAGGHQREGDVQRDVAITYAYAGNYSRAVEEFGRALELLASSPAALGITYDKRGLAKLAMGDHKGAEEDMRRGLAEIRKEEAWFYEATTLLDLARLMIKTGRFDEGILLAQESLKIFKGKQETDPNPRRLAQIYGTLGTAYQNKGEEAKAKEHLEKYKEFLKQLEPAAAPIVRKDVEKLLS